MTRKNLIDFEARVRSLRIWELILAMVEGLRHPITDRIKMYTFGMARWDKETEKMLCVGCAATNTVCRIAGVKFTPDEINIQTGFGTQAKALGTPVQFLENFEMAIDHLRYGNVGSLRGCNSYLKFLGLEAIPESVLQLKTYSDKQLPCIDDDLIKLNDGVVPEKVLKQYEKLAERCKSHILKAEAKKSKKEVVPNGKV